MRLLLASVLGVLALSGCAADPTAPSAADAPELNEWWAQPSKKTPASSVSTRCQVVRASFVGDDRVAYLERSDAASCRPDGSGYPEQSLVVGPRGMDPTSSYGDGVDGFEATPDGSTFVVFRGWQWRVLDRDLHPLGPWRTGPTRSTYPLRRQDGIDRVRISPGGKRVLVHGVSTGWTVFDVAFAGELRVWDNDPDSPARVDRLADVTFAGDESVIVSSLIKEQPQGLFPYRERVDTRSALTRLELGPVTAAARIGATTWRLESTFAMPKTTPGPAPFGTVTTDAAGRLLFAGGGQSDGFAARPAAVLDATTGKTLATLDVPPLLFVDEAQASFSRDGSRVVVSGDRRFDVFESKTSKKLLSGVRGELMSTEISPDGKQLALRNLLALGTSSPGVSITYVSLP